MDKMIGERIKKKRKELKLTQVQIREKTGISNGNLSQIENGSSLPSANALVSLSQLLGVSVDWILTGKEYSISNIQAVNDPPLSGREESFVQYLRQLDRDDQDEILDIMQLKIRRQARGGAGSSSSGDPDLLKEATGGGSVSA